ncbi:MAG: tyrosine-type recombinase/integrase, partial [Myxococcota bacterium]
MRRGAIDRRGSRWRVRVREGQGRRLTLGSFATEAEAKRVLAVYIEAREAGDVILPGATTVGAWVELWIDRRDREGLVRGIRQERSHAQRLAAAPIADIPLEALRPLDVDNFLRAELAAVSRSTVIKIRRILAQALDRAVAEELLSSNPCRSVRVPKVATTEVRDAWTYLRAEEVDRLLRSDALTPRQRAVFTVAIFTGLRRGELFALQWGDLEDDVLVVRRGHTGAPKSGKLRRVPLLAPAASALARWRQKTRRATKPESLIFPAVRSGKMVDSSHSAGWYDKPYWKTTPQGKRVKGLTPGAKTKAGIERDVRFHDLRHTAASHLVMGTWGRRWLLTEVRDFLGHSSITLTERYAHLADDALVEAARGTVGPGWVQEASKSADENADKCLESLVGTPGPVRTVDRRLRRADALERSP